MHMWKSKNGIPCIQSNTNRGKRIITGDILTAMADVKVYLLLVLVLVAAVAAAIQGSTECAVKSSQTGVEIKTMNRKRT